ncbi:MAG: hypothetical protein JO353_04150 [Phycisphaerae bacterium]|nr:hypothetical protein [Phycisphaerae bacterium]
MLLKYPISSTAAPTLTLPRSARGDKKRLRAFTLAEAMIASVILAISVVGIGSSLATSSSESDTTLEATTVSSLGRQLLEEIAAKPFPSSTTTAPGWSGGNHNRSSYDDVADYDGYTDSSPFTTLAGGTVTTVGTYTRAVRFTQRTNPSDTPSSTGNFGLISVTVTAPSGAVCTFSTIISAYTQSRT